MADLSLFEDAVAEIASRLDLREPNREAVQTLAAEVSQHYDVDGRSAPFEAVIDSATGVGKTFILAGAMELFVGCYGIRDFVIVTPGRTILEKTKDNFTPGHPKSLLGPMSFRPIVVTSENFATPDMRAAMDDDTLVKIYLFTIQALIKPESKTGRRTHKFQEGLGSEFYGYLQRIDRLVVFADEHHIYYGPAFSKAVRDLDAWVLVGLTATPNKKTPEEQIIFRYPLAAAIADRLVKTPVIVGRRDDRRDAVTKLSDGMLLLEAKAEAIRTYSLASGRPGVNPVMLVVAKTIEDANEYGAILRSAEFVGGAYADAVLVVHSNAPDEALAALGQVEDPSSPIRIIISVGMLKEGWDVKNVYVIASMRANVSEILTEQTLGRGMRLPFGSYTGIEILDTLEVVAHESYVELLRKAGVLNEAFIDYRTRAALRVNAQGQTVAVLETLGAGAIPVISETQASGGPVSALTEIPSASVATTEARASRVRASVAQLKQEVARRSDVEPILIPLLRMSTVESSFTLSDITDRDVFRKLGASLAADPDGELSRTLIGARVVTGLDGVRRTQLVTSAAADRVRSAGALLPEETLRAELADMVLASPAVPARKDQRAALAPLLDAFMIGLGEKAVPLLSGYLGRAGARLIALVETEQRRFMAKPSYHQVVELREFRPGRATDRPTSADRFGAFAKSSGYEGWERSLFSIEWFDSSTERTVANMVDDDAGVRVWVRLHIGELPILWNSAGQEYNPDLVVIEIDGTHWVVEVKMDKEMPSAEVQSKREAAIRWANYVSADENLATTWKYLLVSETDVTTAKGAWAALKKLGGW